MNDISGTLSICRRAGRLILGMDEVKTSVKKKEARLVLITDDFSENSRKEITFVCERYGVPARVVGLTMYDIADTVGKRCGVMAIADKGFAESVEKKLDAPAKEHKQGD